MMNRRRLLGLLAAPVGVGLVAARGTSEAAPPGHAAVTPAGGAWLTGAEIRARTEALMAMELAAHRAAQGLARAQMEALELEEIEARRRATG